MKKNKLRSMLGFDNNYNTNSVNTTYKMKLNGNLFDNPKDATIPPIFLNSNKGKGSKNQHVNSIA